MIIERDVRRAGPGVPGRVQARLVCHPKVTKLGQDLVHQLEFRAPFMRRAAERRTDRPAHLVGQDEGGVRDDQIARVWTAVCAAVSTSAPKRARNRRRQNQARQNQDRESRPR